MSARETSAQPVRVIGYLRVSTEEQRRSGAGLLAQRRAIGRACRERGWELVAVESDEGVSAKTTRNRPALARTLDALEAGEAGGLIVAKLDRLSRSVSDFCAILDRSQRQRWALVCLDLGLDTSTPTGKFTAQIIAAVAELERELIGQRTREGLESRRAQGVRLGRPPAIPPELLERMRSMRAGGMTLAAIAQALNTEGVPVPSAGDKTRQGREWWPATISRALERTAHRPPANPAKEMNSVTRPRPPRPTRGSGQRAPARCTSSPRPALK